MKDEILIYGAKTLCYVVGCPEEAKYRFWIKSKKGIYDQQATKEASEEEGEGAGE